MLNCHPLPAFRKPDIKYRTLAKPGVFHGSGGETELVTACGKHHSIHAGCRDSGDLTSSASGRLMRREPQDIFSLGRLARMRFRKSQEAENAAVTPHDPNEHITGTMSVLEGKILRILLSRICKPPGPQCWSRLGEFA